MTRSANGFWRAGLCALILAPMMAAASAENWIPAQRFDDVRVFLAESANQAETLAADEFRQYWRAATQCEAKLVQNTSDTREGIVVWIGRDGVPAELLAAADLDALGADAIYVKTFQEGPNGQPALVLSGGRERGVYYAVYEFLERALGVRWLTPIDTHIPDAPDVLPAIDRCYTPQIKRRVSSYQDFGWRHHVQGAKYTQQIHDEAYRRFRFCHNPSFGLFVHTAFELLPPSKYFLEHPEYYSEIDGERRGPVVYDENGNPRFVDRLSANQMGAQYPDLRTQLCFSNPEVAEAIVRELKPRMRAHPEHTIWSVSQMDWGFPCTCAACTAINEREGTPMGALLTCINRVADAIREEFPDNYIETLAYGWSRKPPRTIKPRQNAIVSLCSIECNMIYAMDDERDRLNRAFYSDLTGWGAIADNLYFWDYPANCLSTFVPYPNFHVLQRNMQLWVENNGRGAYLCGGEPPEIGLNALRAYLLARLLWDPYCDYERLKNEFIALYYGQAAPHIHAYIEWITQAALERRALVHVHDFGDWLDYETVTGAAAILERALAAAQTPETRAHVRQLMVSNQFPPMFAQPKVVCDGQTIEVLRADTIGLDAILRDMRYWGMPDFRGRPMEDALSGWAFYAKQPRYQQSEILTMEDDRTLLWIAPDIGGGIIRWRDKASGAELFGDATAQRPPYRFMAFQDWATAGAPARETPVSAAYEVASRSARTMTLRATSQQGLEVERTIALLPDQPGIDVQLTVRNPSEKDIEPRIKLHPEFATLAKTHPVVWIEKDGEWTNYNPYREPERLSVGRILEPDGITRWAFHVPPKNLTVMNEFQPQSVERLLFFYVVTPYRYHINMELFMDESPLPPAASRTLRSRYRITKDAVG